MLLGEALFSFLLVGTALILFPLIESERQRAVLWILPGLVLGLATLCRPVAGLWVLFIGTAVMLRSGFPPLHRLVRVLLMFAGVALDGNTVAHAQCSSDGSPDHGHVRRQDLLDVRSQRRRGG